MEKYRKLKVIGKGSFGHAVLVQSVQDRKTYVMKVINSHLESQIIDVSKMDRKQREDALNEVRIPIDKILILIRSMCSKQ
jgi:NIMA (never in mitosis gene a)-related kinase